MQVSILYVNVSQIIFQGTINVFIYRNIILQKLIQICFSKFNAYFQTGPMMKKAVFSSCCFVSSPKSPLIQVEQKQDFGISCETKDLIILVLTQPFTASWHRSGRYWVFMIPRFLNVIPQTEMQALVLAENCINHRFFHRSKGNLRDRTSSQFHICTHILHRYIICDVFFQL